MLDPNAVTAAIALNQSISAKGIHLVALPDTALALLVREMPTNTINAGETDYAAASQILVDLSRGEAHAEVLHRVRSLSSDSVRRTLSFARNTVMPHVYRVVEEYTKVMDENKNVPMPFDIERYFRHDAVKTNVARDFLERWENAPAVTPANNLNLGQYEPAEILDLVKISDDGDYNEQIAELLNADGGKGLNDLIQVLKGTLDITALDNNYQLAAAVLLHAISTKPKAGVAMTLSAYTAGVNSMANYAAKNALKSRNRLENERTTQTLYHGILRNDVKVISVVGEVYNDLLEKGFTVDMLFGNELLGRKYHGAELLLPENMKHMQSTYEFDRVTRQEAHNLDRQRMSRKAILDVLRNDQKAVAESGEFPVADDSADRSWQRLKGFIDSITSNNAWHFYEPSTLIAATICAVWYAHCDAHRIIDNMFELEKTHKGTPPSELSTLASLKYITEWTAAQIGVGKFSEGSVNELIGLQA